MSRQQQRLLKEFSVNDRLLNSIKDSFKMALERGLASDGQAVKALPTFITSLPKGQEIGNYLVVDLGGSNLRVGRVQLKGQHRFALEIRKWSLTADCLKGTDCHTLFAFIAERVAEYLGEDDSSAPLRLGFTFSYPVRQQGIAHGELIQWNKAIDCPDAVGKDVVTLLEGALTDVGLDHVKVGVLLNDTIATLAAHAYVDPDTKIAVILGTGTNAAYVEQIARIVKLNGESKDGVMLINTEWGAFGDDCPASLPRTPLDEAVDAQSMNPGRQLFEKMISGMYLGEIARRALECAFPPLAPTATSFGTEHLSQIAAHDLTILAQLLPSQEDQPVAEQLCAAVVHRAAALCAASIGAIYETIGSPDERTVVAFDGSLYEYYPGISDIIKSHLDRLCPNNKLVLHLAKNESIVGAAAALAALPSQCCE